MNVKKCRKNRVKLKAFDESCNFLYFCDKFVPENKNYTNTWCTTDVKLRGKNESRPHEGSF
jgi:hypothetical protein